MIFIDRSVPRSVADAVKKMRDDVLWLEDEFPHDVPDEEWLAAAGQRGWLVITHDRKIRTRPGERRAIMEHRVGCFILTYKQDLKKEEIVALIAATLDEMERRFETTPRPFIYTVSKSGEFREYARGPGG
jgi:predicted nuclease of predicted toxin-antitoxin system